MSTILLGKEEVDAYCKDITDRLRLLPNGFPSVLCPIGKSGDHLLRVIAKYLPDEVQNSLCVVPVFYDKETGTASLENPQDVNNLVKAESVLVLDSSVHSGNSMLTALRLIQSSGAKNLISYSLVIKQGSRFLPHYFGLVVTDHDRVLFLLDSIPNNRLYAGKYPPIGFFRRIEPIDSTRHQQCLDTGVASLDKISWGDLYYEHRVNGYDVIVVEDGDQIAGFIKIKIKNGHTLFIDVVANDINYRGKGIGGALMRYAETMGRAHKLNCVELWAIENQVSFYQKRKFEPLDETINAGGGERYTLMRRPLLYHFDLAD